MILCFFLELSLDFHYRPINKVTFSLLFTYKSDIHLLHFKTFFFTGSVQMILLNLQTIPLRCAANSSDQMKDQDLLSHLLKNLASVAGTINQENLSGLLNGSLKLQDAVASRGQVKY